MAAASQLPPRRLARPEPRRRAIAAKASAPEASRMTAKLPASMPPEANAARLNRELAAKATSASAVKMAVRHPIEWLSVRSSLIAAPHYSSHNHRLVGAFAESVIGESQTKQQVDGHCGPAEVVYDAFHLRHDGYDKAGAISHDEPQQDGRAGV